MNFNLQLKITYKYHIILETQNKHKNNLIIFIYHLIYKISMYKSMYTNKISLNKYELHFES